LSLKINTSVQTECYKIRKWYFHRSISYHENYIADQDRYYWTIRNTKLQTVINHDDGKNGSLAQGSRLYFVSCMVHMPVRTPVTYICAEDMCRYISTQDIYVEHFTYL